MHLKVLALDFSPLHELFHVDISIGDVAHGGERKYDDEQEDVDQVLWYEKNAANVHRLITKLRRQHTPTILPINISTVFIGLGEVVFLPERLETPIRISHFV